MLSEAELDMVDLVAEKKILKNKKSAVITFMRQCSSTDDGVIGVVPETMEKRSTVSSTGRETQGMSPDFPLFASSKLKGV